MLEVETIKLVNIVSIVDFITGLCSNTFDTIIKDPEHRLNRLIQFSGPSPYALRCNRCFIVPKCKTDRLRSSLGHNSFQSEKIKESGDLAISFRVQDKTF